MTPDYTYTARVLRVIDADTYEVEIDVGFRMTARLPLRLAHVDTPERNTVDGKTATAFVAHTLGPLPAPVVVRTHKPSDKYGRYLAEVWVNDHSLGQEMLTLGLALPYEGGRKATPRT